MSVEQDSKVSINSYVTQKSVGYSLGRLDTKKTVDSGFTYDSSAGSGTCVYIVDTGIEDSHPVSSELLQYVP